jgi:hypothetical protein
MINSSAQTIAQTFKKDFLDKGYLETSTYVDGVIQLSKDTGMHNKRGVVTIYFADFYKNQPYVEYAVETIDTSQILDKVALGHLSDSQALKTALNAWLDSKKEN